MNPTPNFAEKLPVTPDNDSSAVDVEAFKPSFMQLEKAYEEASAELAKLPETEENAAAIKALKDKIFNLNEQLITHRN